MQIIFSRFWKIGLFLKKSIFYWNNQKRSNKMFFDLFDYFQNKISKICCVCWVFFELLLNSRLARILRISVGISPNLYDPNVNAKSLIFSKELTGDVCTNTFEGKHAKCGNVLSVYTLFPFSRLLISWNVLHKINFIEQKYPNNSF